MVEQSKTNIIDSVSKIVTAVVASGGFIWGIIEFQERQLFNETHEYKRRLWEKRVDTYARLQEVTGRIIIHRTDSLALDSLQNEFDRLYYSSMILSEDTLVESKMVALSEAIKDFRAGIKKDSYLKKKQIELMRELSISQQKKQELLFNEE